MQAPRRHQAHARLLRPRQRAHRLGHARVPPPPRRRLHPPHADQAPPHNVVGCHGDSGAASDWVVCRVFKRARPARRARLGDGEDDDAEESPSSPLSCVTDTSGAGDRDQEEESGGGGCSVASN
ncbi:hypothetical protein BS78_K098900 [Paspalum vaginatum]|uniref:NAC domain-containing protein n=1 Tax=Paspalum vaginatum TaxID=158149 RepID=A0A9W7X6S9_9POAL|nr:hypothetical protein BS78_K098900 [Paspalum vaginatum]